MAALLMSNPMTDMPINRAYCIAISGVMALECPNTVQQIVAGCRTYETHRVGDVFVDATYFLEKPVIPKSTNTPEPPTKQNFMN